jgi:hypothetical protein
VLLPAREQLPEPWYEAHAEEHRLFVVDDKEQLSEAA